MNPTKGRLTADKHIQLIIRADAQRLGCGQFPIPSEKELLAESKTDKQLASVMFAITRVGQQRSIAFQQQLEIWMKDKG